MKHLRKVYKCKWGLYFGRERKDDSEEESNEETEDKDKDGETPPQTPTSKFAHKRCGTSLTNYACNDY